MPASLLSRPITRQELLDWGADRMYSIERVDRWLRGRQELTVEQILKAPVFAGRTFWVVMRPQVLPELLIHQCAVELARDYLERIDARHGYVDLRSRAALAAKQAWINGEISLGALKRAGRRAREAQRLVAELGDATSQTTAQIATAVTDPDPAWCFRQIFYAQRRVFTQRSDDRRVIDLTLDCVRRS